nr:substrate-binding domain-containing protein [Acuticoccus mangrovi]
MVAEYGERILALSQDLRFRIRRHETLVGTVRLGIPDALALVHLPNILLAIERQHPQLRIAVSVDSSSALARRLSGNALDAAVVVGEQGAGAIRQERVGVDEPVWVASPRLVATDRCYGPRDLAPHRIFTSGASSNMFSMIVEWFGREGVSPRNLCSCNSVATIYSLAKAGVCLGVLPRILIGDDIAEGRLFELHTTHPIPPSTIYFSVPRASTNPALQPLLDIVSTEFQSSRDPDRRTA